MLKVLLTTYKYCLIILAYKNKISFLLNFIKKLLKSTKYNKNTCCLIYHCTSGECFFFLYLKRANKIFTKFQALAKNC